MAFGRILRPESRRPSSYYSPVTIGLFVALCLVLVWMMSPSTMSPVDVSSIATNIGTKQPDLETNFRTFDNDQSNLPQDAIRRDGNNAPSSFMDESNLDSIKRLADEAQGQSIVDKGDDGIIASGDDRLQSRIQNEENGKSNLDGGQMNAGDVGDEGDNGSLEKNMEQISDETEDGMQENSERSTDAAFDDEQLKLLEQNSGRTANSEAQGDEKVDGDKVQDNNGKDQIEDNADDSQGKDADQSSWLHDSGNRVKGQPSNEVFPDGAQSELLNETNTQNGAWSTQSAESQHEKEAQASSSNGQVSVFTWKLCNTTAGTDYIPCLDNEVAIKKLPSTMHYEHRERHCPADAPTCLVPLPEQYRQSVRWPKSRDKIWFYNIPHTKLADFKGHQNWLKVAGEHLIFPGGGTQFKNGALHYIDQIQKSMPDIAWGKRSRVILDVGCGVASFGGYLFDRDTLTMSFAPKDEHEAQVQFALERGIPAISAVMGTKRLPFPSGVFDVIHCARCRVPWHIEGGMLLLELNRLLRPGGYFVWSATPVYQKLPEDVGIWKAMSALTKSMCWDMVKKTKDTLNQVGIAIYRKPLSNTCYDRRKENSPPLCQESDDPNAAWNIPLQGCIHRLPVNPAERGSQWPKQWPLRLEKSPYWLNSDQTGVYGKAAPEDFEADYEHWKHAVRKSYLNGLGINWSTVRNVMDMKSVYGGFAAALRDMKVWVLNVVPIESPDTLPIIYERGLIGVYHDWCESFSTYPRSYDLLHADHLFSELKKRCNLLPVVAEVDRILRPEGKLIVRDKLSTIKEIETMAKSLHWEIRIRYSSENEGLLCVQKTMWRPKEVEASSPL